MTEILLYAALVMLASLGGVFTLWRNVGHFVEKNLGLLVSFSAGAFVVIAYNLTEETLEHAENPGTGFLWITLGAAIFWLIFKIEPLSHHHHDETSELVAHSPIDARRVMAGDAMHNLGDGLLLAASFAVSSAFGALTALSIFVHELVQEISEFFVLRQAGYSTRRALSLNLLVSSTILVGALSGFYLLESFEAFEVPILGITAGAFLVVVLDDLIPHSIRASKRTGVYAKHLAWFIIGLVLMFFVNSILGH